MELIDIEKISINKINLRTLFTQIEIEDWEWSQNVIYCIHNDVNGKNYIGQALVFYNRFCGLGEFTHLWRYTLHCRDQEDNTMLYNAIDKYKSKNFTVFILEICESSSELNEKEEYWIRRLHTCRFDSECWGYNMNYGGSDFSQLNTPEAIKKRYENNRKNHGGVLSWNTPESRKKARKSIENHFNTYCNGDRYYYAHTPKARIKNENSKLIGLIKERIDILDSKGLELTPINYYRARRVVNHYTKTFGHIESVCNHMYTDPPINADPNWDPRWNGIFEWFDNLDNWNMAIVKFKLED